MTFGANPNVKLDKYIIQVISVGNDLSAFKANIEQLDQMYDDISIVVMCDGKMIYSQAEQVQSQNVPMKEKKTVEKKGFFSKIFGK